ncbi:coiled-coil and C2 domain-containing protein 2A [Cydia amplana]|uniref:coiled-coil and C2 domain-containing protein 2A n=1 Tax=Cydia amplana TaxID=1869771 RepID=UPI002FE6B12E
MTTNGGSYENKQSLSKRNHSSSLFCVTMSENIELKSFPSSFGKDNDIEEYHEIDEKAISEPKTHSQRRVSKAHSKTITEKDFFTEYDVKYAHKKPGKKKLTKKKTDASNLMDIINSELAGLTPPVTEELVTMKIDNSKALSNTYFRSSGIQMFKKPLCFIPEHGYGDKLLTTVLNPVYPKVLEYAITEYKPIPVQYMEAEKFEDIVATNESDDGLSKFLDMTIKNIKFKHHHELSLEELLCSKLVEIYNEYKGNERMLSELIRDIKVIRETRDGLKEDFTKISAKKETVRFDETVRKYSAKLFYLKSKHEQHVNMRNKMLHQIGSVWSDVLMTREKSGKVKTGYVLDIDKSTKDSEEYEKEWSEVFNIEYTDKLDRIEYDYVTKYVEYKNAKANKLQSKMNKPKLDIDEDLIKMEAETIANKTVTKDKINIGLRQDPKLITDRRKSQKPQSRKYFFKIFVDDVFVCESDAYEISPVDKTNVEFTESFSVQILPKNTEITIELFEQDESVSHVKIALTKIKETSVNADYKTEVFVYNNIVEPNSKHVGCGHNIKEIAGENNMRLKSSNLFKGNLYTTCEVSLQMGWNEKLNENEMESIKSSMEIGRKLKRLMHGIDKPDIDALKNIIENIYEKDIGNDEEIINTLRRLSKLNVASDANIPIDKESPEFIRLKLLHLRNTGGFTNVENKMIPLLPSQISTEQLNCLQKSTENEFDVQYYDNQDMDPIEIQRYIGAKYVEKLNNNMVKDLSEHLLKKTHKDVVRDFKDLSLRGLFSNQSNLSLSLSNSTRQQLLSDALPKDQEIRVSVFRALGLRDRSAPVVQNDDDDDEKIAGFKIRPLRPFVRVSYHKISEQTTPAIGCHPTWNQTIKIKTKLSPLSTIQVNIFDEQRSPVADDSDQPLTVHYRCQNKWLGCVEVPLKTVLDMGMLKGTFKISSPSFLLGYESAPKNSHSLIPEVTQLMSKEAAFVSLQITSSLSHLGAGQGYNQPVPTDPDDYIIRHLNNFVTEYTNEFPSRNISLTYIDSTGHNKSVTHFLQPIPPPDYENFPKNPKSGSAMSKSSRSSSSGRKKDTTEERTELESIYSGFSGKADGIGKMMDACLRYVSLIPCYEPVDRRVVTLLGVELLKVLHGSPLDHTILLTSYFLYLGLKCYIAAGLGLPRGLSFYVLTKYDLTTHKIVMSSDQYKSKLFGRNDGFVWYVYDAVSGERFELRDVSCPLKSVNYVFDNDNIWVNVQSSLDCESVSFDFTRSSDWQPVFDKSIFVMKLPVVTDTSLYSAAVGAENLRVALESRIKSKVQQWRPHVKTIWNRYCSTLLREELPFWEYYAFNPTEQKPGLGQRLKQLMVTHKMFGFPLNMPFVNMRSVISTVKSTGLHVHADPNAEFALGVEIYPYPNNVISVWVFLASISRI